MARIALVAAFLAVASSASALTPAQFGMEMGTRAYEAVCWYENLKKIPTNTKAFTQCSTQAEQKKKDIMKRISEDEQQKYFSKWLPERLSVLPADYSSNCKSDLVSGSADTTEKEGDALGDQGHEYPFRAFAYCMMKTLRGKYGDEAVSAVKEERINRGKHWMNVLNDRENEFRALHGSTPLALDSKLIEKAQKWSDMNAANCQQGNHIPDNHPDNFYHPGQAMGESLAGGGVIGDDIEEVNAYTAANGWYEEIQFYPWAQGGIKDTRKQRALFLKVGHFTQTVWAASQRVGYGYAFNANCPQGPQFFITARYFPAGNYNNMFKENVKPRIQ